MYNNNRKTSFIAAALAAVFIFVGSLVVYGGNVVIAAISALLAVPFFFLANTAFSRYRASLAERAHPSDEQPARDAAAIAWDVQMNGVLVAHIADSDLAEIQGHVAGDWRNMAAQAINILGVPLRVFDKLLSAVPAITFWLILAWALFEPGSLIQTITAIHQATPHEIQQGVSTGVTMLCLWGMVLFMVTYAMNGYAFGFRNVYREELASRVRRHLNIAATGDLTIERFADGNLTIYEPDLLGWYRASNRTKKANATPQN